MNGLGGGAVGPGFRDVTTPPRAFLEGSWGLHLPRVLEAASRLGLHPPAHHLSALEAGCLQGHVSVLPSQESLLTCLLKEIV